GGQNDAARQPTPRRLGWYADAPRGPQHFWHGECPRHLRWLVAPPAQRETFCANAGCLRRRATLCRFLDRRQYHQRESLPIDAPNLLNLGLSGYPLVGADIGGFAGSPPADL